jgi:ribosomal protein L37AE/L43A
MPLFGKKKKDGEKAEKPKEEHVICPHCYLDFEVERIREAGGVCPSCKGTIDLDKLPRARF